MKNKRFYTLLTVLAAIILIGALSLNGKALTVEKSPQADGPFLLSGEALQSFDLRKAPAAYSSYTRISDATENLFVDVPVEWSDIETGEWTYKGKQVGMFLAASSDLAGFYSTRSHSGVFIGVSQSLAHVYDEDDLLGVERRDVSSLCPHKGRFEYQNQFYRGEYDHFTNCKTGTSNLLVFTTTSADQQSLILIRITIASQADLEASNVIMDTFQVLSDPEHDEHHDH